MITLLSRLVLKDAAAYNEPAVRQRCGFLCSLAGIFLNLLLFGFKLLCGMLSASVAITADAFNNLSDAGSSLITLIGFRLSGQKPDAEHPFGHGRMEYISGLIVSFAILLMGFELAKSSLEKILHPGEILTSPVIFLILGCSVLVKLYMYLYNHQIGLKIDSTSMQATAKDSLSDALSTGIVLLATLISSLTGLKLDGFLGLLVSVLILFTGYTSVKDTISPLLGQPPKKEFVREIEKIVLSSPSILGIHDLLVHDYGPGRCMISLHAEVDAHSDLLAIHDEIDNVERTLVDRLGCPATIHMDPIVTDDAQTTRLYHAVRDMVHAVDPSLSMHDFRMVKGPTHTNLVFDVVVPFHSSLSDSEVRRQLQSKVQSLPGGAYYAVIDIDRSYV